MRTRSRLLLFALLFLSCLGGLSPARASILTFNTFGPGDSYQQGSGSGWLVGSFAGLNNQQSIAAIFTPTTTLPLHSVRLATSLLGGENSFIASIVQADISFLPNGSVLETFSSLQFVESPNDSIITLTSATNPLLSKGTFYFLVLEATNPLSSVGNWHWSPTIAGVHFRNSFNNQTWTQFFDVDNPSLSPAPAFQIYLQDSTAPPIPEPSTVLLMIAGFVGLAVVAKRKAN